MNNVYDALIIGGGPAGLSAALALARVHRTCVVFSDGKYRNAGAIAHSVFTRDHTPSKDLLAFGRKEIEKYGSADFVETAITTITKPQASGGHFSAENDTGQKWLGRTVVMACGVHDIFPDLPGYAENWPHNIYQCPFCDGHEKAKMPIGVLCYPRWNSAFSKMPTMLHFLSMAPGSKSEGKSSVTVFANGPIDTSDSANKTALEIFAAHGIKVDQRPVVMLEKDEDRNGLYVHLDGTDNTKVFVGWLFAKPPTKISAPYLVEQLGLETEAAMFGDIIAAKAPFQSTNVPGVFTCGDTGVALTHVTNAMWTGNCAAAGIAHYCNELDDMEALTRYRDMNSATGLELSQVDQSA